MRTYLLDRGGDRDATLLLVLAYAGLRPEEALALQWRHVRERTLLVEEALADGRRKDQKNRRPPRTVELLARSARTLALGGRSAATRRRTVSCSRTAAAAPGATHDYRNWRRRVYQPTAKALGLATTRPYDLRHSFASLLLHEGRLSIVELAHQLGHSPTMALNTYGHVMAELKDGLRLSAEDQIRRAREGADRNATPALETLPSNVIPFPARTPAAPKCPQGI